MPSIINRRIDALGPHAGTGGVIDSTGANLLVVGVKWYHGATSDVSVSDSKGNTWTPRTKYANSSTTESVQFFECQNPTSVGTNHSITISGVSTYPVVSFVAASVEAGYAFRSENGDATGSGVSTRQPGSVTPPTDNALIFTAVNGDTSTSFSVDGGFNAQSVIYNGANNIAGATAYLIQSTAAAVNPTWTFSGGVGPAVAIIVYAAEPGAVPKSVSDTEDISITESLSVVPRLFQSASDTLDLSITESLSTSIRPAPTGEVIVFGSIIGSAGSESGTASDDKSKVVDGDKTTFYSAANASGDWVGFDLGVAAKPTGWLFTPRRGTSVNYDFDLRTRQGLLQSSSSISFSSDVTTEDTVPNHPFYSSYDLNERVLPGTASTKQYWRYKGPDNARCNISEFYLIVNYVAGLTNAKPMPPTINPWGFRTTSGSVSVNLSSRTTSGIILYTLDDTNPKTSPTRVVASGAIVFSPASTTVLRAVTWEPALQNEYSDESRAEFHNYHFGDATENIYFINNGRLMEIHCPGFFYHNNKWWAFGTSCARYNESVATGFDANGSTGIFLASSDDFVNWVDEGNIIPVPASTVYLLRPHPLYNKSTNKIVLWCRAFGGGASLRAMCYTADAPTGPYTHVVDGLDPGGVGFADCNVHKDHNDIAYLVYLGSTSNVGYQKLNSSYTGTDGAFQEFPEFISGTEAPAPFEKDGVDYVIAGVGNYYNSAATFGHRTYINITGNLLTPADWGPYPWMSFEADPVGTNFNFQSSDVVKLNNGERFIYVGDFWVPTAMRNSRLGFLPIHFAGRFQPKIYIPPSGKWSLIDNIPSTNKIETNPLANFDSWYQLNETGSTENAIDALGGRNLTASGAADSTWPKFIAHGPGRRASPNLGSSDAYFDIGAQEAVTFVGWVQGVSNLSPLFSKDDGGSQRAYGAYYDNTSGSEGVVFWVTSNGSTVVSVKKSAVLLTANKYFFACGINRATDEIWIRVGEYNNLGQGTLPAKATQSFAGDLFNSSTDFRLGFTFGLQCDMNQFGVKKGYNHSDAEIEAVFNEGEGVSVFDSSTLVLKSLSDTLDVTSAESLSLATTGAALKTFYLVNTVASGSNHYTLQEGGPPPATITTGTGWTVDSLAPPNTSRMSAGVERAAGTFGATTQPDSGPDNTLGDSFRSAQMSYSFPSGNWYFSIPVIAVTSGAFQNGMFNFRMWKSANADGSSPTSLMVTHEQTSIATLLSTSTEQILIKVFNPGAFTLTNEYLFLQLAWNVAAPSGSTSPFDDVLIRVGSGAFLRAPGDGLVQVYVDDTLSLSTTEVLSVNASGLIAKNITDTISVSVDESFGNIKAKVVLSDTLDLSSTEGFVIKVTGLTISDTLDISTTEGFSIVSGGLVTKSLSDTLDIAANEAFNIKASFAVLDTLDITSDESLSLTFGGLFTKSISDALDISITEGLSVAIVGAVTKSVSDTLDLSTTEVLALEAQVIFSDTLDIATSETVSVNVTGVISKSISESLDIGLTESFAILAKGISISDILDISLSESLSFVVGGLISKSLSDTLNLTTDEVFAIKSRLTITELLDITTAETLSINVGGVISKSISESLDISVSEVLTLVPTLPVSINDTLDITTSETFGVVFGGLHSVSISDTLNVSVSESLSLSQTGLFVKNISDTLDVSINEALTVLEILHISISDALDVTVSEVLAFVSEEINYISVRATLGVGYISIQDVW